MRKLLTSLISCSRASRRRRGGNQAAHPTAQRHSAGREEPKSGRAPSTLGLPVSGPTNFAVNRSKHQRRAFYQRVGFVLSSYVVKADWQRSSIIWR